MSNFFSLKNHSTLTVHPSPTTQKTLPTSGTRISWVHDMSQQKQTRFAPSCFFIELHSLADLSHVNVVGALVAGQVRNKIPDMTVNLQSSPWEISRKTIFKTKMILLLTAERTGTAIYCFLMSTLL